MAANEKKPSSRGRMPSKRAINFAEAGKKKTNYMSILPIVIGVLVVLAVVAKFAILDRLDEVSVEEAETQRLRDELNAANAKLEGFGDLTDQYAHYTYSGMTTEELTRPSRITAMHLIDKVLSPEMVRSWTVRGDMMQVEVTAKDLRDLNLYVSNLERQPSVRMAQSNNSQMVPVDKNDPNGEKVLYATIEIYLNRETNTALGVKEG